MILYVPGEEEGLSPRVRGNHELDSCDWKEGGLSPRVRGNPGIGRPHRPGHGSIPACAGEPRWGRRACPDGRVYPRVCGGTLAEGVVREAGLGLSPRVRGNHPVRVL